MDFELDSGISGVNSSVDSPVDFFCGLSVDLFRAFRGGFITKKHPPKIHGGFHGRIHG